jgi:hypothetical protein
VPAARGERCAAREFTVVSSPAVAFTFVVGAARDVFPPELAQAVEEKLRSRFALPAGADEEAYRSDHVEPAGWLALQKRLAAIAGVDAYQAVFVPAPVKRLEEIVVQNLADPLHVAGLEALLKGLHDFAAKASLPTDDVKLMALAARYLEDDSLVDQDLDVQTYVQLMLSAKQAAARKQPLWIAS